MGKKEKRIGQADRAVKKTQTNKDEMHDYAKREKVKENRRNSCGYALIYRCNKMVN